MASTVRIEWDAKALGLLIGNCQEGVDAGRRAIERMAEQANAMAGDPTGGRYSGYPDGGILTHPKHPEYEAEMVQGRSGYSWIGFVHAANAAGQADAVKNNTLAKVL